MAEILDFFKMVFDLFTLPSAMLQQATDALNGVDFDKTLPAQYLGYMHFAMGNVLYSGFTGVALIMVGASLWSFILKGIDFLKSVIPFN